MDYFQLGRTDLNVSAIGFGAIPIIRLEHTDAVRVLRYALERQINFFDTANAYRDSEEKIGSAFAGLRDQVILASKTQRRDGVGVQEHLQRSLTMLQTDYLDLYQFHQVSREQDWQAMTAPGGALEEATRARQAGLIRYLGVTSHSLPMALRLVRSGLFDTIQFPFNLIEEDAANELFPLASELGQGIIVMKPFAGGVLDDAAVAFKYLRQFPHLLPIPGFESIAQIDQVLACYDSPNQVGPEDLAVMERYRRELGQNFCRRCEYCQPCPQGVKITPAMAYRIVTNRMTAAIAPQFSRAAMETVPLCNSCGSCVERCPYDLPIPATLKEHYQLFQQHLSALQEG
ncbi:aldo/keto reductase [Pelobacter seleniigenes]|uniref:aldo/keto reductase n=1 Tax=Pelobacter seleniigenes TaxID=407188 RepID=UPI0004A75A41|nr:aldo/keto reductase [Pelobacter seleniigenes]